MLSYTSKDVVRARLPREKKGRFKLSVGRGGGSFADKPPQVVQGKVTYVKLGWSESGNFDNGKNVYARQVAWKSF